jgi:hypothetical protein
MVCLLNIGFQARSAQRETKDWSPAMEHQRGIAALVLRIVTLLSSMAGRAVAQERIKFPVGVGPRP